MFYKCAAKDGLACLCSCPLGKHFESESYKCIKTKHNWSHTTSHQHQNVDMTFRKKVVFRKIGHKVSENDVIKLHDDSNVSVAEINASTQSTLMGSNTSVLNISKNDSSQPTYMQSVSNELETPSEEDFIVDSPVFPIWAIAFLALCVVIAAVFVGLIMY